MTKPYVDKTGTDEKPDPLRDVFQEFPLAMMELARITRMGATKHAPRGWQTFEHDYALNYHRSKIGRHLLKQETEGMENYEDIGVDGKPLLHPGQVAWNALAFLEHLMKQRAEERNE